MLLLLFGVFSGELRAQVYVSSFSGNEVFLYDEVTGLRIGSSSFVDTGLFRPHGILERPSEFLVANWNPDEIRRHDRVDGSFLGTFADAADGLSDPVYLEVGPLDGYLYVSSQANDRMYRFPVNGEPVDSIDAGPFIDTQPELDGPGGFDWSPDGSLLYVSGRYSTNVVVYNASTGAMVSEFNTSDSNNNTFGLAVDDASGDLFVAVDGNVIRYNSSGVVQSQIAIPGTAIGIEPSADGSAMLVAANNNLYSIALSDFAVTGPLLSTTAPAPSVLNFFHVSQSALPPRSVLMPFTAGPIEVMSGPTQHLGVTFDYSVEPTGEELVLQLSTNLNSWNDAAIYTPDGVSLTRNASTESVVVDILENGDQRTITERMSASTSTQTRGFARVLRRAAP